MGRRSDGTAVADLVHPRTVHDEDTARNAIRRSGSDPSVVVDLARFQPCHERTSTAWCAADEHTGAVNRSAGPARANSSQFRGNAGACVCLSIPQRDGARNYLYPVAARPFVEAARVRGLDVDVLRCEMTPLELPQFRECEGSRSAVDV